MIFQEKKKIFPLLRGTVCFYCLLLIFSMGCLSEIRDDETIGRKIVEDIDGEPVVPRSANRLYVGPIINETNTPTLSSRLMNKILEFISLDGRLGVDSDDSRSDLRLEVRISKYMIEKMQFDGIGRAVKKRIWVTADVRLFNLKKNKVIFTESDIQAFKLFSDLVTPIETEMQVREEVLDTLARRITAKTVSGWYTDLMTPLEKRE